MTQFESITQLNQFMPHGSCYLWQPDILWLHLISDSLIGISYLSLSLALLYFSQKGGTLPFKGTLLLFSSFIFACGLTHFMNIWTTWNPDYYLEGFVKALTAIVSLATAVLFWPLVHKALTLPNLFALQEANNRLEQEVRRREGVEQALRTQAEDLKKTNGELMETNRAMTGRELRMIELKQEVNELCQVLNRPLLYPHEVG